jgi:hypothetical protein
MKLRLLDSDPSFAKCLEKPYSLRAILDAAGDSRRRGSLTVVERAFCLLGGPRIGDKRCEAHVIFDAGGS